MVQGLADPFHSKDKPHDNFRGWKAGGGTTQLVLHGRGKAWHEGLYWQRDSR
ncbi:MAG: hypothetical protein UZ16_OP3001001047 [Candidatus Hinthialibacteria bacterium OLB16]|nr:MAG: hypothetical protein UZ16_OP3001001047 [Candidatus Hinthialibacteria bacterium OLB16]